MQKNIIDNLKIIREIGKGGFGKVFLVEDTHSNYFALKVIDCDEPSSYKKELNALNTYKKLSTDSKDFNIVPILDVKIEKDKISYLMPLADSMQDSPIEATYKPKTLFNVAKERYSAGGFFATKEILDVFLPIFKAVDFLNNKGIMHRDIKPDNILFINNKAYLADIGLMREDTPSASSAGTPIYTPPSWYIRNSGKVDMWGIATSLYFFLTGNSPDTMGKANYRFPEAKEKMPDSDIHAYEHFHRVILRAGEEKAKERYLTFEAFCNSFKNITSKKDFDKEKSKNNAREKTSIFSFKGRLSKTPFTICFATLYAIQFLLPYWIVGFFNFINTAPIFFGLLINYPLVMISIKRVHDAGFSAKWGVFGYLAYIFCKLINIIMMELKDNFSMIEYASPLLAEIFITAFAIAIFASLKGEKDTNKYGTENQKLSIF